MVAPEGLSLTKTRILERTVSVHRPPCTINRIQREPGSFTHLKSSDLVVTMGET